MEISQSRTDVLATSELAKRIYASLAGLGFRNETGMYEYPHGSGGEATRIIEGPAFYWDSNNGVYVVYDNLGQAWVRRHRFDKFSWEDFQRFIVEYRLMQGAYVPHSNGCDTNRCRFCRTVG